MLNSFFQPCLPFRETFCSEKKRTKLFMKEELANYDIEDLTFYEVKKFHHYCPSHVELQLLFKKFRKKVISFATLSLKEGSYEYIPIFSSQIPCFSYVLGINFFMDYIKKEQEYYWIFGCSSFLKVRDYYWIKLTSFLEDREDFENHVILYDEYPFEDFFFYGDIIPNQEQYTIHYFHTSDATWCDYLFLALY